MNSTMNKERDEVDISVNEMNLISVGSFPHSNGYQTDQTETESEEESGTSSILKEGAKRTKEVLVNYLIPRKADYGNKDSRTPGEKFVDGEMPPYQNE